MFNNQKNYYPNLENSLNNNYPLIPNSQEYIYYKKYVSIHSEDRNILKYPNSSEFEIELPEDLINIVTIRLSAWSFPSNYDTFSLYNKNITMSFLINKPYDPKNNEVNTILELKTFEFLFLNQNNNFYIIIETGFYNPIQMVNELTNKFNNIVTIELSLYFTKKKNDPNLTPSEQNEYAEALILLTESGGYSKFIIVYNNVSQKIWFGNTSDGFVLTNETQVIRSELPESFVCATKETQPDFSDWGLPYYIGLNRCNKKSLNYAQINDITTFGYYNGEVVPRFFYGDVFPGDSGYWLLPNPSLTNSHVEWIECDYKINLMGPSYMYMEIAGLNCINETQPYNLSQFTLQTNQTNGIVNSSFAKIGIPTTPISQWFDRQSEPYMYYYPPLERIRKLNIKLRYHNGGFVNFGVFNYSFMLEFVLQQPIILRKSYVTPYPVLSSK
jgi:hypothetical protein